jgi:hypothetical protein
MGSLRRKSKVESLKQAFEDNEEKITSKLSEHGERADTDEDDTSFPPLERFSKSVKR